MKKKIIYLLLIIAIFGIGMYFMVALNENSDNGFDRKMVNKQLRIQHSIKLEHDIFFSWKPERDIWISSRHRPLDLLRLNNSLGVTEVKSLKLPNEFNSNLHNLNFSHVDSSIFVANEVGQIARLSSTRRKVFNVKAIFDNPVAISANSIAVRLFKNSKKGSYTELCKIVLTNNGQVKKSFTVPKQFDGIFCSDGLLQYDEDSKRLFYMYYRRGSFLCLDTNLNLLYSAKTVDTINRANLKLIDSERTTANGKVTKGRTLNMPGDLVNIYFSVFQDKLYLYSGVRANNQSLTDFFQNSTIDVYALNNGNYLYSFLMPKHTGLLLRQFHVENDNLIALYDRCMVSLITKQ
ncbi:hypothetical protein [Pedobacter sp. MC2016-24]|uniref:hypothetical protein n=1 Tax=Pedobacter sp. MC2016-24 TaxID=2780090 RepID=UPI001881D835|nr:hypothetical protein [Pedobacter sp. MC2016-24]MBE9601863.1 hypothetical protein [Pedobacter sp. MC2016-24]